MATSYHAVAKGKVPGLYSNLEDAMQQTRGFPEFRYQKCMNRASALKFMERHGIQNNDVRLFIRGFTETHNFKPQTNLTFDEEFKLYASSQKLASGHQTRSARIAAMRDEIIYYYLNDGLMLHQVDDDTGNITLTKSQTLRIYQAMCRQSKKTPYDTLEACLTELKCRPPFVNLNDFINVFRTGQKVNTFHDWHDFRTYTKRHPVDLQYAKESEFLAPLLQNLNKGPHMHLGEAWKMPFGNRDYASSQFVRPAELLEEPALPEDPPIKLEPPDDTLMHVSLPNTYQSRFDHPPLSPMSEYDRSPSPSLPPRKKKKEKSKRKDKSEKLVKEVSKKKDKSKKSDKKPSKSSPENETTTSSCPPLNQISDIDLDDFEDFLEDDQAIFTQLSQPSIPPIPAIHSTNPVDEVEEEVEEEAEAEAEEQDFLASIIQSDDEICTQLSLEWSQVPRRQRGSTDDGNGDEGGLEKGKLEKRKRKRSKGEAAMGEAGIVGEEGREQRGKRVRG